MPPHLADSMTQRASPPRTRGAGFGHRVTTIRYQGGTRQISHDPTQFHSAKVAVRSQHLLIQMESLPVSWPPIQTRWLLLDRAVS